MARFRRFQMALVGAINARRMPKGVDDRNFVIAELRVKLQECFTGPERVLMLSLNELQQRLHEIDDVVMGEIS